MSKMLIKLVVVTTVPVQPSCLKWGLLKMGIPDADGRHPWLRFELMGLTLETEGEYLRRQRDLYYRQVFRVPALDFGSLEQINGGNDVTGMRDTLEMIHRGVGGEILFRSYVWRSLFGVQGPLIRELMLEFFSTLHYRQTDVDFGIVDTLVFRLGGVARQMSVREFILALGLHTEEELGRSLGNLLVMYLVKFKKHIQ